MLEDSSSLANDVKKFKTLLSKFVSPDKVEILAKPLLSQYSTSHDLYTDVIHDVQSKILTEKNRLEKVMWNQFSDVHNLLNDFIRNIRGKHVTQI